MLRFLSGGGIGAEEGAHACAQQNGPNQQSSLGLPPPHPPPRERANEQEKGERGGASVPVATRRYLEAASDVTWRAEKETCHSTAQVGWTKREEIGAAVYRTHAERGRTKKKKKKKKERGHARGRLGWRSC